MMDTAEVTVAETLPVVQQPMGITPMSMLEKAVVSGSSIEIIERLMDLQERWDVKQARKAFDEAMANAKAEIPTIIKNRAVDFTSAKGRTNYRYEDLESVASAVSPVLSKYGLSYRFRATSNVNEPINVTCIISHRAGHFEEMTLCAGRDESGNKNSIQAIGSTLTYLQRMTLKAALGLAVSNDDDGNTEDEKPKDSGPPRQQAKPAPEQARDGTPPRRQDPISSGPQTVVKDMGPSDGGVKPHKIPGAGETYETWSEKYSEFIRTSPDITTLYQWIDANNEPLGRLAKGKPSIANAVKKVTENVLQALKDAKEKADAKAAKKAKPAEMEETVSDIPADPELTLKLIDSILSEVSDIENLEPTWVEQCEPKTANMFPPDAEEAIKIYRKHEARLTP